MDVLYVVRCAFAMQMSRGGRGFYRTRIKGGLALNPRYLLSNHMESALFQRLSLFIDPATWLDCVPSNCHMICAHRLALLSLDNTPCMEELSHACKFEHHTHSHLERFSSAEARMSSHLTKCSLASDSIAPPDAETESNAPLRYLPRGREVFPTLRLASRQRRGHRALPHHPSCRARKDPTGRIPGTGCYGVNGRSRGADEDRGGRSPGGESPIFGAFATKEDVVARMYSCRMGFSTATETTT